MNSSKPHNFEEHAEEYLNTVAPTPLSIRDEVHLIELLFDGLNSGAVIEVNSEYWAQKKRVLDRLGPIR